MSKQIRIGAIGIDSSHLPEFTRRINALNDSGATTCRVTSFWSDGKHDLAPDKVEKMAAIAYGVDMISVHEAQNAATKKAGTEKPSLESVELQRAAMTGDLELRENIIRDMVSEFKKLQRSLEEEKERFDQYAGLAQKRGGKDSARAYDHCLVLLLNHFIAQLEGDRARLNMVDAALQH